MSRVAHDQFPGLVAFHGFAAGRASIACYFRDVLFCGGLLWGSFLWSCFLCHSIAVKGIVKVEDIFFPRADYL
jgi:hypothetical protein